MRIVWVSNGVQREDKTLLQCSQLCQHGKFRHANASEWQQSRLCGQNLCGAFVGTVHVLAINAEDSNRAMAADSRQKRLYLHHQGEFQQTAFVQHSDHDSVVRIFVGHPSGGSRNFERGVQQVGWLIYSAPPRSGDQSVWSAEIFFYMFFLAIRKRSRSISAHSGHVPRCKEDWLSNQ